MASSCGQASLSRSGVLSFLGSSTLLNLAYLGLTRYLS